MDKLLALPPLRLYSDSLLSKWGFDDGELLRNWLNGIRDDEPYCELMGLVRKKELAEVSPLVTIVRTFLLPALTDRVVVEEIGTIHNPIRARTVNGQEVDWFDVELDLHLTPEFVDVQPADVLAILNGG